MEGREVAAPGGAVAAGREGESIAFRCGIAESAAVAAIGQCIESGEQERAERGHGEEEEDAGAGQHEESG